jgi:myxalamid-type polyketide synthase MxaE and MxaD
MKPVAIVGIGCHMPGARGPEQLWELLETATDAIREVPADRWDVDETYDPDPATPGKMTTRWGGFLEEIDRFDSEFFGISPREAARMDPQQRLTLEVAWEALADAGIAASALAGSQAAVLMGVSTYDHGAVLAASLEGRETYDGTGSALSIVANRLSYLLNVHGPSLTVDTACSSSLVAVHLACRAIEAGETELALVGGVNVITSPVIGISFSKGGLMAPDGRCKPFDHRANGYVRSEGVGVVILKPLERALADGDRVYATVLGSAVNQDGRSNGLVAPNRLAQEAVLRDAYRTAGIDPADVDYVEAHGTGTAVGDPIEVAALASVLGPTRPADRPLHLGSVKSNIGHLEAAAGIAGLIKTALALQRRTLIPTLHYEQPNPMLGLERLPIVVQARSEPWPEQKATALAGVSAFGFGGSNAHVVLSAAAPVQAAADGQERLAHALLVPLSARSQTALQSRALAWAGVVPEDSTNDTWLADVAAAASLRDDHHPHRASVIATNKEELAAGMRALAAGERLPGASPARLAPRRAPQVVLVFPGQGSQWHGMGRSLAASVPAFGDAIARCDAAIAPLLGHGLWDPDSGLVAEGIASVQPALFAMQVALAETWRAWGVSPSAVVGQSVGEIAAAHISGALSLSDAARVVCERSRLLAEIAGSGGLMIVELAYEEACELTRGREHELSLAGVNGPRSCVLSGALDALEEISGELRIRGVFVRRIAAEVAGHSPQVEPLQPRLLSALAGLQACESTIPFYSTVSGEQVLGAGLDDGYWERNLRAPTLLPPAIERMLHDGYRTFVEVAPHPVLGRSLAQVAESSGHEIVAVSALRRDEDELVGMLRGLGELYTCGVAVNFAALHPHGARPASIPTHPWQRTRFPVGAALLADEPSTGGVLARPGRHRRGSVLAESITVATESDLRLWRLAVDLRTAPELTDHRVDGQALVPGAYWLTAAAEAASAVGEGPSMLERVTFTRPAIAEEDSEVQLGLRTGAGDRPMTFAIASMEADGRSVTHVEGVLRRASPGERPAQRSPEDLARRCPRELQVAAEYARLEQLGLEYGPRFHALSELRAGDGEALARINLPDGLSGSSCSLHPAMLDGCLHAVAAASGDLAWGPARPLPAGARQIWVRNDGLPVRAAWCHARVLSVGERELEAEVVVFDDSGEPLWALQPLLVRASDRRRSAQEGGLYAVEWTPVASRPAASAGSWLVLSGETRAGLEIADRLMAAGQRCLLIPDGALHPAGDGALDAAGYDRLLSEATTGDAPLRGVIDARATETHAHDGDEKSVLFESPTRALLLAQTLAGGLHSGHPPPRLWLITSATQPAADTGARTTLAGGPLWGLGRVLAGELSELGCSLVDLPLGAGSGDYEALLGALLDADSPQQLLVRENRLLAPMLAVLPPFGGEHVRLHAERTYLITGGLGSLGIHIAHRLLERGAGQLVLVGRNRPTPALEHELAALREGGALIDVRQADVGDCDQLAALLDDLAKHRAPLAGVVHAAGMLEDAIATNLDSAALHRALHGKALGAWNLHRLTRDLPLDLFVLFSSLAGMVGSPGQAAYAAANSFLDSLASHRSALGLPAVSIDWGPWAGSLLNDRTGAFERLAMRGAPPLTTDRALELLDQALASGRSHLLAAAFDWDRWRQSPSNAPERLLLARLAEAGGTLPQVGRGRVSEQIATCSGVHERRRTLRRSLVEEIACVLSISSGTVDRKLSFQELGVDSLMAIELRDRLEVGLDMKLSAALMWAHPNVDSLAEELLTRVEEQLQHGDSGEQWSSHERAPATGLDARGPRRGHGGQAAGPPRRGVRGSS